MTIREIYSYCINELESNQEKFIDTELLLSFVLKKDRIYIKTNLDEKITSFEEEQIKVFVKQLKNNKPIHYIIGQRDFYGYDFLVDEHVLIPRSDTEILVENAINILTHKKKALKGLEIGVGSGIISIILLKKLKNLNMTAIDINDFAIDISKKNADNLGVTDRLKLIKSDLFENIEFNQFDMIVSNPPYISLNEIGIMSDDALLHEPSEALFAENDGLYFYYEICQKASDYLADFGYLLFEIGYKQGKNVAEIMTSSGFKNIEVIKDLAGLDRVVVGQKIINKIEN